MEIHVSRIVIASVIVATLTSPRLIGQQNLPPLLGPNGVYTPTLTYDVASIRRCKGQGCDMQGADDPLHLARLDGKGVWVVQLIGWAFGVDWKSQVQGGPDWVRSAGLEIHAKSDSVADDRLTRISDDDARLEKQHMLQSLLAERFRLRAHAEIRQTQVFVLTIARGGPKLHRADNTGTIGARGAPKGIEILGHGVRIADFLAFLKFYLRVDVIDKTGLADIYDFDLQFHGKRSDIESDDAAKWPPAETAMKEQLGLELRETTGPMKFVVIDHIEMPSEN